MLHYCVKILLVLGVLIGNQALSQDAQFTQFFLTRQYLNPAFTGNVNAIRLSSHIRRQWAQLDGYTSSGFYADANLRGVNSGIGLSLFKDVQSQGGLNFRRSAVSYAYGNRFNRNTHFRVGLGMSYNSVSVDPGQFLFTDQMITGSSSTVDPYEGYQSGYFDFSSGALVYTKKQWLGVSVANMRSFVDSDRDFSFLYPVKFSAHGGWLIPINSDAKGEFFESLTVAMHYKAQEKYDQLDLGAYYGYSMLILGVWYRNLLLFKDNFATPANHDALAFVLGVQHKGSVIAYSYDISVSPLSGYSGGAHELGIKLDLWANKNFKSKKNSRRFVPCPEFGPSWGK